MIIANVGDLDYRISFKHDSADKTIRATICTIESVPVGGRFRDNGNVEAIGEARCDARDNFEKAVGRKYSIKRAMSNLSLNKSDRRKIWNAYLGKKVEEEACVG